MTTPMVNKEVNQSRVHEAAELFDKYGYTMFPQQWKIYNKLAGHLAASNCNSVLEAGSGNGIGTAILNHRLPHKVTGSDKLRANCEYSQGIYPWIPFLKWDINEPYGEGVGVAKEYLNREVVVAIEVFEHVANPQQAMQNLLDAATKEVWISTPNGLGKERPPSNPYHVQEYTTEEMFDFVWACMGEQCTTSLHHWETFERVDIDTKVNPLVYRIAKL
jgi:2-polyprenyl-3-methyl-5-hydroxy-6-metoxy-1,4-benzoquinol methylase